MQIISRSDAKALGLKFYFTGKPCPRGHVAERRVSECDCIECKRQWHKRSPDKYREAARRYREAHREKVRDRLTKWRDANRDRWRQHYRRWNDENREKTNAICKRWRDDNQSKCQEMGRNWRACNPHMNNAKTARRNAAKLNATPPWLTHAQQQEMLDVYEQALLCRLLTGVPHDVAHIEPLKGLDRSGLHVPWNLQILPSKENQSKGNRPPSGP